MRKILIPTLLILFTLPCFSGILKLKKEVDLSFFLRPNQPDRIMAAVDDSGNLYITQWRKDEFLKLDRTGKLILRAPSRIEGEIGSFDLDNSSNIVCMFPPKMVKNITYIPLVWFDGNGKRKREINLGNLFEVIISLKILRPEDIILVNGVMKEESLRKYSLHTIDFEGNHKNSFSPVGKISKEDIVSFVSNNREYFSSPRSLFLDQKNRKILQFLPFSEGKKVRVFNYSGNLIDEMSLDPYVRWRIIPYNDGIWIYTTKEYTFFKSMGAKYFMTEKKMEAIPWYFLTSDLSGNLYFVGEKSFQVLKIYTME